MSHLPSVTPINHLADDNVENDNETPFLPRPFPPLIRWTAVNAPARQPTPERLSRRNSQSPSPSLSPQLPSPPADIHSTITDDEPNSEWTTHSVAQALLDFRYGHSIHSQHTVPDQPHSTDEPPTPLITTALPPHRPNTPSAALLGTPLTPNTFTYLATPPETPERPAKQGATPHFNNPADTNCSTPPPLPLPATTISNPHPPLPSLKSLGAQSKQLAIAHGTLLGNELANVKKKRSRDEARMKKRGSKSLVVVFAKGAVRRSRIVVLKIGREEERARGMRVEGGRRRVLVRFVGEGVEMRVVREEGGSM